MLWPAEARRLLEVIDTGTLAGLRDRALVSVMLYSFARVSAVIGMRRQDDFRQESRGWLRLHEKGGMGTMSPRTEQPAARPRTDHRRRDRRVEMGRMTKAVSVPMRVQSPRSATPVVSLSSLVEDGDPRRLVVNRSLKNREHLLSHIAPGRAKGEGRSDDPEGGGRGTVVV